MPPTKHINKQDDAPDPHELVARNVKLILKDRTPEAYLKEMKRANKEVCYISGTKKGKPVGHRTLRALVGGEFSPGLDLLAAIAWAEQLELYQLLFYDFDPTNAPVMISRDQQNLLDALRKVPKVPKVAAMKRVHT